MYSTHTRSFATADRYSAKKMEKPVNFICHAPEADHVSLIGDFNGWRPNVHPMKRQPDGNWLIQIPLHHGHHRYVYLVDGVFKLDPKASGIARDDNNERVSLMAVS